MLKIGLTGGIGSGKTTVADIFAQMGVPIIDADLIAKELTVDAEVHQKIVDKFGADVLLANGELNRKKIRQIIFTTPYLKKWLENLLHPLIREEISEHMKNFNFPYCIIVIPLLVENEAFSLIDRVLVINATTENQLERVISRDKVKKEEVLRIIHYQATQSERLAVADDIIQNDGDTNELIQQVKKLHAMYLNMAHKTTH